MKTIRTNENVLIKKKRKWATLNEGIGAPDTFRRIRYWGDVRIKGLYVRMEIK